MLISIEVTTMEGYDLKKDVEQWEAKHPRDTYDRATGILFDAKSAPKMPRGWKA